MIKDYALKQKFDILLVFMFDRIGRIADETPFVVEWLISHGIRVWASEEGEQRIESHTDRLMNYIRFWQADGESQKTAIRTANSLHILTEQGYYTGGSWPSTRKKLPKSALCSIWPIHTATVLNASQTT